MTDSRSDDPGGVASPGGETGDGTADGRASDGRASGGRASGDQPSDGRAFGGARLAAGLALAASTAFTLLLAGARDDVRGSLGDMWQAPELIWRGVPYALGVLAVLLARAGAYALAARRHGVRLSGLYFIPAPTVFGTLGGFATFTAPRKKRFDIAAAGAFAGLAAAITVSLIGLHLSEASEPGAQAGPALGSSFLFHALVSLAKPDLGEAGLSLHALAFAGWTGLFITALGLVPVGPLDGGHIGYALFGRRQRVVAGVVMAVLLALGVAARSPIWIIWPLILLVLGYRHASETEDAEPLGRGRVVLAIVLLAAWAATFVLVPQHAGAG